MIDYVNVKKPSGFRFWAKKSRLAIRYWLGIFVIVLLSMLGGSMSKERGLKRNQRDDAAKDAIKRRERARKAIELMREVEVLLKEIM